MLGGTNKTVVNRYKPIILFFFKAYKPIRNIVKLEKNEIIKARDKKSIELLDEKSK